MMKRLLVITLLLFVCVGVAAAEQVELVWYHCCGQVERNVIFDKWAREFEAQNPDIKINAINPAGSYNAVLTTTILAGSGPDIFWAGIAIWRFADLLLPLDDLFVQDKAIAEILPVMREAFRWDGKIIAIPFGVNAHTIFYNKDLLAEAGLNMPPDWDWTTAVNMAKQLQKDANGDGVLEQWGFTMIDRVHALTYAGNVYSDDGKRTLVDNPITIQAMQFITDFMGGKLGVLHDSTIASNNQTALLNGQLAMGNRGVFDLPIWRRQVTFDWDVTYYPRLVIDGKDYRSSWFSPEVWSIGAYTKHPEEAKRFVRFLLQKEQMLEFAALGAVIPTQSSVAVQGFLNEKTPANLKAFTDTLAWWRNGQWAHPADISFEQMQPWIDLRQGTVPASTAVPEMARLANQRIDEFWANRQK
jgi:ABC-type glycerol-3-phosphate transport system substrate-binding protein